MEKEIQKTENKFEGLYIIGWGLGGGFGGARNFEVIQVDSQDEADQWAFDNACEEYEMYSGNHGLRSVSDIMEEDGIEDEEEAVLIYEEERETWLDYSANPYTKEYEKKVMYQHYENRYKEITGDCN